MSENWINPVFQSPRPPLPDRQESRRAAMAQAAKRLQMTVGHPDQGECFREGIGIELRIRPRARDRAYIDDQIDSNPSEQIHELGDRSRRMADREDRRHSL